MVNTEAIREKRERLGLSQDQAAEEAGMKGGRAKWNDIEKGRNDNPSLRTLIGMARALKCSVSALIIEPKRKSAKK